MVLAGTGGSPRETADELADGLLEDAPMNERELLYEGSPPSAEYGGGSIEDR